MNNDMKENTFDHEAFGKLLAAAMSYDGLMTLARRGKATPEDMVRLEELTKIIERDVQKDLVEMGYGEVG